MEDAEIGQEKPLPIPVVFKNGGIPASRSGRVRRIIHPEDRRILKHRLETGVVGAIETGFLRGVEVTVGQEKIQDKENQEPEKEKVDPPLLLFEAAENIFQPITCHEEEAEGCGENEFLWKTENREHSVKEPKERRVLSQGQGQRHDKDTKPEEDSVPETVRQGPKGKGKNQHSGIEGEKPGQT
jgi:hypothetical protein